MKVLLLDDVYKQGVAGEIVDVAPGFARNYLIPRGLAVKATPGALKQMEKLQKQVEVRRDQRSQRFEQIAEKLEGLTLYFGVKAGETGKLYGSVTSSEIAEELKDAIGLEIDRRRIGDRPLRELGESNVPVRLEAGLAPTVRVVIHREGEDPRDAEAALAAEAEAAEAAAEAEAEMLDEAEVETEAEMATEAELLDEAVEEVEAADEVADDEAESEE
jgi:large subunit ribosomal protein L9